MGAATETAPRWYGSREVAAAISPARARALIEAALLDDFDPANDPARVNTPAGGGHLLLMPSVIGAWAGIKVASVGPNNPEHGRPRIQATYVLMDSLTLSPQALMEGSLLTALRTPAVSAVAANKLAAPDAGTLLVFGTGLQAWGHIEAMAEIRTLSEVWISGRSARKVEEMVGKARGLGLAARAAEAGDVENADIIVCATSAGEPLFDGSLVKDGAAIVAMGSHETDRRELDANLMGRARVVVEDVQTALREAGDVVMAIEEGRLDAGALLTLSNLVRGNVARATDRPNVFKGTGMSWQDLAVAVGVHGDTPRNVA
ncbi:ornithine cyclodeaminase family protein [Paeniglutamicibacter kerguelensis]|uniref:Ornithine cyclodeaminase n=1 Tax=Paeniglutamicibacter kerguelensis TaxID=254788 RepID=A0ABS4XCI9_9MICC|nr:ornithine cyclodeaminase family protein [Paeniglutamicibacter kerguelensis]MBP2386185.1 ornithine cyclodeaminase [Paeniglutamicibacter kerguelensis]